MEWVIKAGIILHDMIIEDERDESDNIFLNPPSVGAATDDDFLVRIEDPQPLPENFCDRLSRLVKIGIEIQDLAKHMEIRNALVDHLWTWRRSQ